jgi:hypothetical protein
MSNIVIYDGEVITTGEDKKLLVIKEEEALALNDYFLRRAGYISHEFDQPVIEFNKRLDRYCDEIKFKDISKEEENSKAAEEK